MRDIQRRSTVALVAVLGLLGSACSGSSSDTKAAEPTRAPADVSTPAPDPDPSNGIPDQAVPAAEAAASAVPLGAPVAAPRAPTSKATAKPQDSPRRGTPDSIGPDSSSPSAAATDRRSAAHNQSPSAGQAPFPGESAATGTAKENYASDVGVTKDRIRIGIINMASAARSLGPAIAQPTEKVIDSAVKYINRTGGVNGRRLELVTCDDGGDIARARACYEKLKDQVFAFVPSETWLTDVIHDRLVIDKVPWLSWGWFKSEYENPWMFPFHANGTQEAIALSKWVSDNIKPKSVGILYLNVAEDISARDEARRIFESRGIQVVTTIAQEWDSPDESQHVLAMRAANPDFVVSFSWPAPMAKFFHDARSQKWAPKLGYGGNHLIGDPAYGSMFSDYIKGRLHSITSWLITEDTPELQLYRAETRRNYGDEMMGFKWRYGMGQHLSQSGWIGTRVLAKAAATLGADLTRNGFKKVLETNEFDSGMGVILKWPEGDHAKQPYAFNREYLYKWIHHPDGGWDIQRLSPDPVANS